VASADVYQMVDGTLGLCVLCLEHVMVHVCRQAAALLARKQKWEDLEKAVGKCCVSHLLLEDRELGRDALCLSCIWTMYMDVSVVCACVRVL
jgi:hypothetical protein